MQLEWNFIGASFVNWSIAFRYFTDVLGFAYKLNPDHGDWAELGGGWDAYYAGSNGTTFELFDDGRPESTDRRWGKGQAYRPAIHVRDLETSIAYLKSRGVIFSSEIESRSWGRRIEFIAPESVRLALLETSERAVTTDWQRPIMATMEIKAHNIAAQIEFYTEVMGLHISKKANDGIILRHAERIGSDKAQIILEEGGNKAANDPSWSHDPVRGHPFFLSFATSEIEAVNKMFHEKKVAILRGMETDESWNGTDIHITDADGNPIQIVQYH